MLTTEKRYNGWTNYETWVTKLWMDNDEGSYRYWQEVSQECMDEADKKDDAIYPLSKRLQEAHEENAPTPEAGLYTDLLTSALQAVNWYEIAESLLEDVEKED